MFEEDRCVRGEHGDELLRCYVKGGEGGREEYNGMGERGGLEVN